MLKRLPRAGEIWRWGYKDREQGLEPRHYLFVEEPRLHGNNRTYEIVDVSFLELETGIIETCLQYRFYWEDWRRIDD